MARLVRLLRRIPAIDAEIRRLTSIAYAVGQRDAIRSSAERHAETLCDVLDTAQRKHAVQLANEKARMYLQGTEDGESRMQAAVVLALREAGASMGESVRETRSAFYLAGYVKGRQARGGNDA